jgi:hypothetical protein
VDDFEQVVAFATDAATPPREVRINFGIFAGRAATPAEVDELANVLLPEFGEVTLVAEERHEVSEHSEGLVHQVRIELPAGADADKVVELAERWAQACIADRHAEVSEL